MNITATNKKIRVLLKDIESEKLIPQPEFQRRLVWLNKDKLAFLDTVLKGYPFPEIYIADGEVDPETGEGKELLVDGQQRITTLLQYFTNSELLKLDNNIKPYSELTREEKINFLDYEVVVRQLGKITLDEIKEVFRRINATKYTLNLMEIQNSFYNGELIKFTEEIASDRFFSTNNVFSTSDIRRMGDISFVLLVVITIMSNYFSGNKEFETYLNEYNDEFAEKEQYKEQLDQVFKFIENCNLGNNRRAWHKTNLFTLIVEVYKVLFKSQIILEVEATGKNLRDFYEKLDAFPFSTEMETEESPEMSRYYRASRSSTDNRASRIVRGEILSRLLRTGTIVKKIPTIQSTFDDLETPETGIPEEIKEAVED